MQKHTTGSADRKVSAKHLGQIDALRGVAVLGVLAVHGVWYDGWMLAMSPRWLAVFMAGQRGVQLFFIVSAFTLALSHEQRTREKRPLGNYFIRRLFRITPMFYVAIVLTYFLVPSSSGDWKSILLAALFLNGLHPAYIQHGAIGAWSIADEVLFYCLLPLLLPLALSVRRASALLFCVATISNLLVMHLLIKAPELADFWTFHSMVAELPVFLLGLLAYQTWRSLLSQGREQRDLAFALITVAVIGFALLLPFSSLQLLPESLMLALFTLGVVLHPPRVLVNSFTVFMGKISFSFYLLHFYPYKYVHHVFDRYQAHLWSPLVAVFEMITVFLVTTPLALLTWHFVERPGIRLGARLIARLEGEHAEPTVPLTSLQDTTNTQF